MRDSISRESTIIMCSKKKKVSIKNNEPFRIGNTNTPTNISIVNKKKEQGVALLKTN